MQSLISLLNNHNSSSNVTLTHDINFHDVIEFVNEGEDYTIDIAIKIIVIPIIAAAFTFGIELLIILREHIS
jgi:hypothetical protein